MLIRAESCAELAEACPHGEIGVSLSTVVPRSTVGGERGTALLAAPSRGSGYCRADATCSPARRRPRPHDPSRLHPPRLDAAAPLVARRPRAGLDAGQAGCRDRSHVRHRRGDGRLLRCPRCRRPRARAQRGEGGPGRDRRTTSARRRGRGEEVCDVGDLDAVRAWASGFVGRVPEVHGLVHNAGVMVRERSETPQGHELDLSVHVLGPHLMTELLLPALQAAEAAGVVWMSSGGMYGSGLRDADDDRVPRRRLRRRPGVRAHEADAGRARRRLGRPDGGAAGDVRVESMHPGWVATPGVSEGLPTFDKVMGRALPHRAGRRRHRRLAGRDPPRLAGHPPLLARPRAATHDVRLAARPGPGARAPLPRLRDRGDRHRHRRVPAGTVILAACPTPRCRAPRPGRAAALAVEPQHLRPPPRADRRSTCGRCCTRRSGRRAAATASRGVPRRFRGAAPRTPCSSPHLSRGNAGWVPRASVVLVRCPGAPDPSRAATSGRRLRALRPRPGLAATSPCRLGRWACTPTSSPASTRTRSRRARRARPRQLMAGIAVGRPRRPRRGRPSVTAEREQRAAHPPAPRRARATARRWGVPWTSGVSRAGRSAPAPWSLAARWSS